MAETLAVLNKKRWDNMHIPAANGPKFKAVADRLTAAKARYQVVEKATGVPWWFIAVTHQRESSQNWNTYLGNGQSLGRKTTIVPKGRGPFKTWEEGAIDALVNCPPYAARNKDWTIGNALATLEKYNGLGYYKRNLPSPYLWAGTDQYVKGKFVADGVYDPNHVDTQLGVAGLLKFMGIFSSATATNAGVATGAATGIGAIVYSVWNYGTSHWEYIVGGLGIVTIAWLLHSYFQSIKEQPVQ